MRREEPRAVDEVLARGDHRSAAARRDDLVAVEREDTDRAEASCWAIAVGRAERIRLRHRRGRAARLVSQGRHQEARVGRYGIPSIKLMFDNDPRFLAEF